MGGCDDIIACYVMCYIIGEQIEMIIVCVPPGTAHTEKRGSSSYWKTSWTFWWQPLCHLTKYLDGCHSTVGRAARALWEWYDSVINEILFIWNCVYQGLSEQMMANVTGVLHALQVFEVLVPVVPDNLQAEVKMIISYQHDSSVDGWRCDLVLLELLH